MCNKSDDFTKPSISRLDLQSVSNYLCTRHIINNYLTPALLTPPFHTPQYTWPGAILMIKIDKLFMTHHHKYDPIVIKFYDSLLKTYLHQINDELTIPRKYKIYESNPSGSHERKRIYTSEYDRCNLLLEPRLRKKPQPKNNPNAKPKVFYPPSKSELHDPTYLELDQIIQAIGYFIKYSRIEVSFDFYSTDILAVNKFLSEHVILPDVRTHYKYVPKPGESPYTTYLSDVRKKNAKGGIIYIKDGLFVRVELILNRKHNRDNNIDSTFRSLIQNLKFEDRFRVLYFDKPALFEYISKKLNTTDPKVINRHYGDYDFSHPQADEPLVDTVQKLKHLKVNGLKVVNWSRFLKPIGFPMKIIKK